MLYINCIFYSVHSVLYSVHSIIYTVHCILYTEHCLLHTENGNCYVVQCTLLCTLYPVNCTKCSVDKHIILSHYFC